MTPFRDWKSLPASSGVYFLKVGPEVIYVGQSLNIQRRIRTHPFKGRFDSVEFKLCRASKMFSLENWWIQRLKPELNGQCGAAHPMIRIDPETHLKLIQVCREKKCFIGGFVNNLIQQALKV